MPDSQKLPTRSYLLENPSVPIIHRDLSWLQFNQRVLREAIDRSNPHLKRLKFLSIAASNLDEFFMIRMASLLKEIQNAKTDDKKSSLIRIYETLLEHIELFNGKHNRTLKLLQRQLKKVSIHIHTAMKDKTSPAYTIGQNLFNEQVLPHILPRSQFKYSEISNLKNLQSLVYCNDDFWFELPTQLASVYSYENDSELHFYFLDDLIRTFLNVPITTKSQIGILRITRDSDISTDLSSDDPESIPNIVRKNLTGREKGKLVRIQYCGQFPLDFFDNCTHALKLEKRQVFKHEPTLCMHGLLSRIAKLPESILSQPGNNNTPLVSLIPKPAQNIKGIFNTLKNADIVLHHPYDSYEAFENWLVESCYDENVVSIEQTIYRTDASSRIIQAFKDNARKKKIIVVFELRARFDEWNNLSLAEELKASGVKVAFGFGKLKLHAKITLVSRKEHNQLVRYTHLSTGNYNSKTARLYTDIAILTCQNEIGNDARHFFDSITKGEIPTSFQKLVVAPALLHQKIRSLIKDEIQAAQNNKPAYILAKVNSLVDDKVIEDLYKASKAGVKIDLIVRSACSLIPGVKGLSENIRVFSIVDRFLEHSRIYYFKSQEAMYLSSADWMPRNFFSRLEIAFPVLDQKILRHFSDIVLPAYLEDNIKSQRLTPKGVWVKNKSHRQQRLRVQFYLEEIAKNNYQGTPLYENHHSDTPCT